MSTSYNLIAPALAGAAVTAVLAGLLFFLLKKRDGRKSRQLELRYAEYKKCLQVLEEIAAVARVDFKQSYAQIATAALKDILGDDQSSDYGARVEKGLADLAGRLRESFARATGDLHGMGLVCPDPLLARINEF